MYTPFYKDKNRISNKTDFFFCLQTLLVLWEDLLRWRKEGGPICIGMDRVPSTSEHFLYQRKFRYQRGKPINFEFVIYLCVTSYLTKN